MINKKLLPLSSLKVLELEGLAPSIFCGMMLADYGAEVIQINKPVDGPLPISALNTFMNRSKKSIFLNLKKNSHIEIFKKLLLDVDIIIDPYRPGVLEKLGIGPKECHEINKRLIINRITGYGQTGDLKDRAGHDLNYLAYSGMLSTFGKKNDVPSFPNNLLADFAGGGALSFTGVLLAVIEREKTGLGQVIDFSMAESTTYLGSFILALKYLNEWNNPRGMNFLDSGVPFYNVYKCKDDRYIVCASLEPKFYKLFIENFGLSEEEEKKCLENQLNSDFFDEMKKIFEKRFQEKTLQEWTDIYEKIDACVSPVLNIEEIPKNSFHQSRKNFFIREVKHHKHPFVKEFDFEITPIPKLSNHPDLNEYLKAAPVLGEHTFEILKRFKISEELIKDVYEEFKCKLQGKL